MSQEAAEGNSEEAAEEEEEQLIVDEPPAAAKAYLNASGRRRSNVFVEAVKVMCAEASRGSWFVKRPLRVGFITPLSLCLAQRLPLLRVRFVVHVGAPGCIHVCKRRRNSRKQTVENTSALAISSPASANKAPT